MNQGLAIGLIGSDSAAYQRADAVARLPGARLVAIADHDEPAALRARELVDRGAVGAVSHVRASHGHNGVEHFGAGWSSKAEAFGGGALMSGGGYMIDQVRWFLGEISEAGGYGTEHVWHQPGSEDNGFVLMRSADGRVGQVHASWSEWRRYRYQVEIYGTSGYVRFGYSPLWLSYAQGEPRPRHRLLSWPRYHFFPWFQVMERLKGYQWSLTNMYETDMRIWINAITTGSKLVTSGHDGREVVRIAQSISRIGVS